MMKFLWEGRDRMPEPLKNYYNRAFLEGLAEDIKRVHDPFAADDFLEAVLDSTWESLELLNRFLRIAEKLREFLPADYPEALGVIDKIVMNYGTWLDGSGWFFPLFVELYGQDPEHWDITMDALARYTVYASSESAVRPYIIIDEERMMAQMYAWSKHENEDVRRLASEGCRPQLPWTQSLPSFKKDPSPILPILEQLKDDPSPWVRRSVANNLNDISKTHPELVTQLAKEWHGQNKDLDWVVKHGCRTLLKKGNREVLTIFGYGDATAVSVQSLAIGAPTIAIGEDNTFSFELSSNKATKVRLEYGVDYVKATGKRSRKIFQLSEGSIKENETKRYTRKHSFKDVSVRKHHPGSHSITLIVNGVEQGTLDFELEA